MIADEYFVQFYCWEGVEPTPDAVLEALRGLGIEARRSDAFPDSYGELGWRQSMLVGFPGEPIFIEIYRPQDRWEGTRARGTFEEQLETAKSEAGEEFMEGLTATKYIVATNSLTFDAARRMADLIGSILQGSTHVIARFNDRLELR